MNCEYQSRQLNVIIKPINRQLRKSPTLTVLHNCKLQSAINQLIMQSRLTLVKSEQRKDKQNPLAIDSHYIVSEDEVHINLRSILLLRITPCFNSTP